MPIHLRYFNKLLSLQHMIQQRIIQYIDKEDLFSSDSKILVALSGGADSVALLCILHAAGYHC